MDNNMKAASKRILLYLVCILTLTSCNGAVLKSLRGLFKSFKSVPTKELVRRVPKTVPKSAKKSLEWTQGIDDVVRSVVNNNDSSLFSSPDMTPKYVAPKYNSGTNSFDPDYSPYKTGIRPRTKTEVYAPFKFETHDLTVPKVDLAPRSNGVNLNRNSGGYKPNPYMGTSTQLQLNKPATLYPNSGLQ